jgi:uncharacterized protein with PQ loop repeat
MVLPQVYRTRSHPGLRGVSTVSWSLTALCSFTWILFGIKAGALPQIPGNVVLAPAALMIVLTAPSTRSRPVRFACLATAALFVSGVSLFSSATEVGFVAFGMSVVSTLPQTITSLSGAARTGATAVSVPAWSVRAISQVFWLIYAVVWRDLPIMFGGGFTLLSSIAVASSERRHQARSEVARVTP